jgi:hypothetical protein
MDLPPEIRNIIWAFCYEARDVELPRCKIIDEVPFALNTKLPVPALLHLNRETRTFAKHDYKLFFRRYTSDSAIYFNPHIDTLSLVSRSTSLKPGGFTSDQIEHWFLRKRASDCRLLYRMPGYQKRAIKSLQYGFYYPRSCDLDLMEFPMFDLFELVVIPPCAIGENEGVFKLTVLLELSSDLFTLLDVSGAIDLKDLEKMVDDEAKEIGFEGPQMSSWRRMRNDTLVLEMDIVREKYIKFRDWLEIYLTNRRHGFEDAAPLFPNLKPPKYRTMPNFNVLIWPLAT